MTSLMTIIKTNDTAQTIALGEKLGQKLNGGEVIELISDLGGGKTTLVRGLAAGFGSSDHVSSPTFTISKIYKGDGRELHHFDFYRLPEAGLIAHELDEVIGDPNCSVVVEWADVVRAVLPKDHLTIRITKGQADERRFEFSYPQALAYLVEGLK